MRFKYLNLCAVILFLLTACGGSDQKADPQVELIGSTELTQFAFLKLNNPDLHEDVILSINSSVFSAELAFDVALNSLVATFEHGGSTVSVNGVLQTNNVTTNDFRQIVTYQVATDDGRIAEYQIDISQSEPVENTELTLFSFLKSNNPDLHEDVILSFNSGVASARLTTNAAINNLVATFEHGGTTVTIDGVTQTSSVTTNNFSQLQIYQVATSDGQMAEYQINLIQFTGLPIIYITTEQWAEIDSKDDYVNGTVSVQGGREFTDLTETSMKIRGRGNSTWDHPKKPYQMKLSDKAEFLGMPAKKKWLFLAEYSDKTLLRNTITFEMGYISQLDWTPRSTFAEVYINDTYNGTYNITEKVEEGDSRVAIGDTGYLLEIDQDFRLDPDDIFFHTDNFLLNIKSPDVEQDSSEYNYVKGYVNTFEDVLMGPQYTDPINGYQKYINVDSFIDWYLINEINKNVDAKNFSSIYLTLIPGNKIKMGPLWDFDLSFGNVDYADSQYAEGFWVKNHAWYTRLFQDPAFVDKVKVRFSYFKQNQQYILDKIDSHAQKLQWAQQENDNKWHTLGMYVWPNPVVFDTYEEEVEHLKSWYIERMNWLDTAFNKM
ncbi:CotH kinase family protein [Colwellia piezophila]|uniref:CotH kinase family protein n=1 Tax=Colwellia piezophila TaxID=211668 RepID=UPI000381BF69|nr:CotH kinase family protein [Colwellia piezophila]